jgi:hypothetical protein
MRSPAEAAGRAGALALTLPVAAFFAVIFMKAESGRSLWGQMAREPTAWVVVGPLAALVAFIALRPLASRPPGRITRRVLYALSLLALLAGSALLVAWYGNRGRRFDHELAFWATVPWPALAGVTLGRASRMEGWAGWSHSVAALAFGMVSVAGAIVCEGTRSEVPDPILLVVVLVTWMLPIAMFIAWPRGAGGEVAAKPVGPTE